MSESSTGLCPRGSSAFGPRVYDGFDVLADDSVERALVPCPFGVERGGGIKGTCVCVLVGLKDNGLRVNRGFPSGFKG